jgi:putative addiction module killer protein
VFSLASSTDFVAWFDGLADQKARALIDRRLARVRLGNLGDWKSVGDDVFEMRVDLGPGYRIYFLREGRTVVLLMGGDKSTQRRDIKRAKAMAQAWREHDE